MAKSDLEQLVELAQRRVRTAEGARLYGKNIGDLIGDASPAKGEQKRPITLERIKSLQAQFAEAKRTGNTALMKSVQEEFRIAVREFRAERQDTNLLRELTGELGQQAQASQQAS